MFSSHLSVPSRAFGRLAALCAILGTVLWCGAVSAEAYAVDKGSQKVLEATIASWDALSAQERRHMARLYGELRYAPALPVLRSCAAADSPEAASCMVALVALDDIDSVVLMRQKLRTVDDPQQVAIAAETLGRWGDRLSYSLLNKALLLGTGGDLGSASLVRAVLSIPRGPERGEYVEFARRRAPAADGRLVAAARLAQARRGGAAAKHVAEIYQETLALAGAWGAREQWRAQAAAWGLSRAGAKGCQTFLEITRDHLKGDGDKARAQAMLGDAERKCWWKSRRKLEELGLTIPAKKVRPKGIDGETLPSAPGMPWTCGQTDAWLAGLALRSELWESGAMPAGFESMVKDVLCAPEAMERGWGFETVSRFGKGKVIKLAPPPKDIQTRTIDEPPGLYPESFNDFKPDLDQPDWFPEHIEITIDDGPMIGFHQQVHKVLEAYKVKVTFFMCGVNIIRHDNAKPAALRKTLERIIDGGHHIAYHTMNHITRRKEHVVNFTPAQLKDDVDLYRLLFKLIAEKDVDIVYGRMPGGLGSFRAASRAAYHHAGMATPVFWNAGPPGWPPRAKLSVPRRMACEFISRKPNQVILLLHETAGLDRELMAFFDSLKACKK